MATKKQLANLKRGGAPATPAAARKAREAKAAHAAEEDRLAEIAGKDPYAAYEELHGAMTRHMLRLIRSEARSGAKPARDTTDRLREYRQLTEALAEYLRTKGAGSMADGFFAQLETQLQRLNLGVCQSCGGPSPKPYLQPEKAPKG